MRYAGVVYVCIRITYFYSTKSDRSRGTMSFITMSLGSFCVEPPQTMWGLLPIFLWSCLGVSYGWYWRKSTEETYEWDNVRVFSFLVCCCCYLNTIFQDWFIFYLCSTCKVYASVGVHIAIVGSLGKGCGQSASCHLGGYEGLALNRRHNCSVCPHAHGCDT